MIDSKDITNMVRHIIRRDQGVADTQIMHPLREWVTGIVAAIVLIIVGAWFSFVQYRTYVEKRDTSVSVIESAVPYQTARIATAIATYTTKRTVYNLAIGNKEDAVTTRAISEQTAETIIPVIPEPSIVPVIESTSTPPSVATTSISAQNNPNPVIDPDAPVEMSR